MHQDLRSKYTAKGELDDETATHLYENLKMIRHAKPYATIPAFTNVYEIAIEQNTPPSNATRWRCGIFTFYDESMTIGSSTIFMESRDCMRVCAKIKLGGS